MTEEQKLYFRDQLREARVIALKDAEAFEPIIHVLERKGRILCGVTDDVLALGRFQHLIAHEASCSPLAEEIPVKWPELHLRFIRLYTMVTDARNAAMHEGSLARHLTEHAIELSIILEHALMDDFIKVKHFMVKNPVCAATWQPLSFIRQTMLASSFSYLPVSVKENDEPIWKIVSDLALARYLQLATSKKDLRKRLTQPLQDVVDSQEIKLFKAQTRGPEEDVKEVIKNWDGLPILVMSKASDLLGILTPFDVL